MSELNALGRALMMGSPDDITTGNMLAGMPEKSLARILMDAARSTQNRVDALPWWVKAPVQPFVSAGEAGLGTIATGASGAENVRRGINEDDPWRTAGGIGELGFAGLSVLPAAGPVGRTLMGTAPRALATTGAMLGLSMSPLITEAQAAGLSPAQEKRKQELQRKVEARQWSSGTERREVERELADLRRIETEYALRQNEIGLKETERKRIADEKAVADAQGVRDRMLGDAWKPFHEEYPNAQKLWPMVPLATAAALQIPGAIMEARGARGAMNKLATLVHDGARWTKPSQVQEAADIGKTLLGEVAKGPTFKQPAIWGALEGAALTNTPDLYNWFGPGVNPEYTAQLEYIKRLPEGHPERARAERALTEINPKNLHRQAAQDYFTNPVAVGTRTLGGAIEGGVGATMVRGLAKPFHPSSGDIGTMQAGVDQFRRVVSGEAGTDAMRAADTMRMLRGADQHARAPLPPPVGPPTGPSGTQGPGQLPPPTGGINGTPTGTRPETPRPTNPDRFSYPGSQQQAQVQQAIFERYNGTGVLPTLDELRPHLTRDSGKTVVPKDFQKRLDNLTEIVTDLKTIGTSDDQIANFILKLMQSGKHTLPAVAAGTMGLNAMQFGGEPQ